MITLLRLIRADIHKKAQWCYESTSRSSIAKTIFTDGTAAMILYRLMQSARRYRLIPAEMIFNKLNAIFCNCIIGRGAEFGPGFVLIHSTGVVINGGVCGGRNVLIEHQVTIGAERRNCPRVGNDVFIGAGAKVIGSISVGDGARVGANAVVVRDVPANCTVVGIPASIVRRRESPSTDRKAPAEPL